MSYPVYRLIDIAPNLAVAANHVVAVKQLDEDSCAVFLAGQSAVDGGFRVERPWDQVIAEVNDELMRAAEEVSDYEDDENENEDDEETEEGDE